MSRDDIISYKLGTQLTDRGLTAKTYTRETCEHYTSHNTYVVVQEVVPQTVQGLLKVDDFYVNGDYLPCSDWAEDDGMQVTPKLTGK